MPAVVRRSLLRSIRYEDLLERFRLLLEEIFIVSVVRVLLLLHGVEEVMSLHGDVMDVNVEQDFDDTSYVDASKPNASVWRMIPQDSTATAAAASVVRRGRGGIVIANRVCSNIIKREQ